MENIVFEDDMKEFRTRSIAAIVIVALMIFLVAVISILNTQIDMQYTSTVLLILLSIVLCCAIYSLVYISVYKVTATDTTLNMRSLFGQKSFTLEKGLEYTSQILAFRYRLYKISVGSNKITVRTKKTKQLESLLQKFVPLTEEEPSKGVEEPAKTSESTVENTVQSENADKTQISDNKGDATTATAETHNKYDKLLKILGVVTSVLTAIAPIVGVFLSTSIGEPHIFGMGGSIRYLWIMWLFLPIGICCAVVGVLLKKRNLKYKRNLRIAVICIPILFVFGLLAFVNSGYTYDTTPVVAVEKQLGIDLPNQIEVVNEETDFGIASYCKLIDEQEKQQFEAQLATSSLWQKELNPNLAQLLPMFFQMMTQDFDYFLFYNATENTFNTYPSQTETNCIYICYSKDLNRLFVLSEMEINLENVAISQNGIRNCLPNSRFAKAYDV